MRRSWEPGPGDLALERLAGAGVIGIVSGEGDRFLAANDFFLDLVGYPREELLSVDWRTLTPPEWSEVDRAAGEQAVTEGVWRPYEKELRRRDGGRVPVLVGGAVTGDGPPVRFVSFVVDLSAQKAADVVREAALLDERAERSRLAVLQRLTAALSRASSSSDVADVVLDNATAALGASAATISLFRDDVLVLVGEAGLPSTFLAQFDGRPVDGVPVAREVRRSGRAVLVRSFSDRDRRFPSLVAPDVHQQAWANLPMVVDGEVIGLAAFGWDAPRDFAPDEVALLEAVAGQCATALQRANLLDSERTARTAAERAQEHLAVLARASRAFAHARSEPELLSCLADVVAPLCAWSSVLVPDDRDRLVRVRVRGLDDSVPVDDLTGTIVEPLREGDPRLVAWRTGRPDSRTVEDVLDVLGVTDPHLAARLVDLPLENLLAVPLTARGQVLGVLGLWRGNDVPAFAADEVDVAADLGNRAGTALDALRTLASRTHVAAVLQASLLPDALPEVPGIEMDACYIAAEAAAEVGGDFYDVFKLAEGEYAFTIGDVSGRGVEAAGLTGLARTTLHAVPSELGPAEALARLNDIALERTGLEKFLTAAYIRLRLHGEGVEAIICTAGHPPPLLIRADGSVVPVGEPGPLLGQFDAVDLPQTRVPLSEGDTVLLFTDGVIEAHGPDGLFGDERLLDLAAAHAGRSATHVVDAVRDAVLDYRSGGPDDLALLAFKIVPRDRAG